MKLRESWELSRFLLSSLFEFRYPADPGLASLMRRSLRQSILAFWHSTSYWVLSLLLSAYTPSQPESNQQTHRFSSPLSLVSFSPLNSHPLLFQPLHTEEDNIIIMLPSYVNEAWRSQQQGRYRERLNWSLQLRTSSNSSTAITYSKYLCSRYSELMLQYRHQNSSRLDHTRCKCGFSLEKADRRNPSAKHLYKTCGDLLWYDDLFL